MHANPIHDTTENQMNIPEISTTCEQVFEHTSAWFIIRKYTVSKLNFTTVPSMLTDGSLTPNSTPRSGSIEEKAPFYNRTTYYYHSNYGTSSDKSHSRLSRGAIAGINIGVIALLCCFGMVGACLKRGH